MANTKMMMMRLNETSEKVSHPISEDLIHEILLRLPIKSLVRFQLVSKQWQSIIFNPYFTKSHHSKNFNKSPHDFTLLMHPNNNVISTLRYDAHSAAYTKVGGLDSALLHHVIQAPSYHCAYAPLGSCDGLICLYNLSTKVIYLWNPITKESRNISPPGMIKEDSFVLKASGFGFVPSINDYKIVILGRYVATQAKADVPRLRSRSVWKGHVYTMRDDEWRELDVTSICGSNRFVDRNYEFHSDHISMAVLFQETLHWAVGGGSLGMYFGDCSCLTFDMVKEVIKKLSCSRHKRETRYYGASSFGIIEPNNLGVCQLAQDWDTGAKFVELWMLEQYGECDSWKKLYRLDFKETIEGYPIPDLLGVASPGNVVIHTNTGLAFVSASCNGLNYIRDENQEIVRCHNLSYVVNYVPSLASPHYYVPTFK